MLIALVLVCPQGPKLPSWHTGGQKKWNHGAPLSKKSKGVGRGFNKSDTGKFVPKTTTVTLPADRNEVMVPCTRDFLIDPPAATGAENAVPEWAQPPTMQPPPVPVPPGLDIMQANA